MSNIKLHLDEDASTKALQKALQRCGHDVTRTPNDWIQRSASDEEQLFGATKQGRCIFTFNIKDFVSLSREQSNHGGIILASQSSWEFSSLICALDNMLSTTELDAINGTVRWLTDWRN